MGKYDEIRPYYDNEVHDVLKNFKSHPFMKALLAFTFPDKSESYHFKKLEECYSIYDLQDKILSSAVNKLTKTNSEGFTTSGFENLDPQKPYLYLSNHRDIIMDTSLLNITLHKKKMIMTASAIGDNLIEKPSLKILSRLSRNFVVHRDLAPREMLEKSKLVSEYIQDLLSGGRSVWLAHRQGRTKDGNDELQQGVLKMLIMARGEQSVSDYLKQLNIVMMTISYEFDPTDILKIPELLAKHNEEEYIKTKNEDFNTILKGLVGYKGHIHLDVSRPINDEIKRICDGEEVINNQLQKSKEFIDRCTHKHYKLWPSNYVAYDMLYQGNKYDQFYTDKEKRQFERRVERRVSLDNKGELENFLNMYANPVVNNYKY